MLMLKELRFKTDQEKSLQRLKKRQTKDINLTAFVSILIYILFYLHHFFLLYCLLTLCDYSHTILLLSFSNSHHVTTG